MGFVKITNDLPSWAWYGDNNTLLVYIRLLFGAVWRETEFQNVTLQRGQIATTLPKIARENGITERQARTILERLKSTGKVSVKTTSKFSIITLENYDCVSETVSQFDSQMSDLPYIKKKIRIQNGRSRARTLHLNKCLKKLSRNTTRFAKALSLSPESLHIIKFSLYRWQ